MTNKDIKRFWEKVRIKGPDECWIWKACKDKDGYGIFTYNGKNCRAHIFSFVTKIGIWPGELIIRHTCNNPPCCNPNHLIDGTQTDNMHDKIINITTPKLTENEIKRIRYLGMFFTGYKIARMPEFKNKIKERAIYSILTNESWKHIF